MTGFLHRADVIPLFKEPPREQKPPRRLRRQGKKYARDAVELRAARKVLLARSRGYCEACGSRHCTRVGVEAHHVRRRSQGGTNDPENLLWICHACHVTIHTFPKAAARLGLLAMAGTA